MSKLTPFLLALLAASSAVLGYQQVQRAWAPVRDLESEEMQLKRQAAIELPAVQGDFPDIRLQSTVLGGVPVYVATPPNGDGRTIVYFHGGAYTFYGGVAAARDALILANYARMTVISVDYRLAPKFPFPAALDDAVAVWLAVIETKNPNAIGIGGTSAGGGLALALVLRLKQLSLQLPGAVFAGTPWADLTHPDSDLKPSAKAYVATADPRNVLVSPLFGDFSKFPPTIIIAGTEDFLLDTAEQVYRKIKDTGGDAEIHVYNHTAHAQYVFDYRSPASVEAWEDVAAFFKAHLAQR